MIQRIQSVYFLLAGILPAFTFCVPMAQYLDAKEVSLYSLSCWSLTSLADGNVVNYPWGILLFACLSILMAFVCIFSYKNRRRQISLSNILLTVILLFSLTFVAYGYSYADDMALRFLPDWGVVFPGFSFLFALLGRSGVCKDEELVRAADRIR